MDNTYICCSYFTLSPGKAPIKNISKAQQPSHSKDKWKYFKTDTSDSHSTLSPDENIPELYKMDRQDFKCEIL